MDNKYRKLLIGGLGIAGVLIMAVATVFIVYYMRATGTDRMYVYHFNAGAGRFESVARPWPEGDEDAQIRAVLGSLFANPQEASLTSTWPEMEFETAFWEFLTDIFLYEGTLVARFSEMYHEIPPLEEALFRMAFTMTFERLDFVNGVKIVVDEGEWRDILRLIAGEHDYDYEEHDPEEVAERIAERLQALLTPESIANDPTISPARLTSRTFNLHFIDESGEGLVIETFRESGFDLHNWESIIIQRLIEGPSPESGLGGAFSAIPPETVVRGHRADGPAIYINLSSDFNARFSGSPTLANLMIHTIVNSLTHTIPSYQRVHFLIESVRMEQFHGVPYFDQAFVRDDSLMLAYDAHDDYYEYGHYEDEQ